MQKERGGMFIVKSLFLQDSLATVPSYQRLSFLVVVVSSAILERIPVSERGFKVSFRCIVLQIVLGLMTGNDIAFRLDRPSSFSS